MLKYAYIFQIKYTEAILSNITRKLLWFEFSKMLIAVKNKFTALFIIIIGTLSFRRAATATMLQTNADRRSLRSKQSSSNKIDNARETKKIEERLTPQFKTKVPVLSLLKVPQFPWNKV